MGRSRTDRPPAGEGTLAVGTVVLGIDTATAYLALALVDRSGAVLAQAAPEVARDHAARIVPELEALFWQAAVDPGLMAGVAVGVGPGSYTGLRVGIATAKGLATGWGVPVAGSDTLGAVADAGLSEGETGIAAIDARRGNLYYAVYRRGAAGAERASPPAKASRDEVAARHPGVRIVEGIAPSSAWHARRFDPAAGVRATYL